MLKHPPSVKDSNLGTDEDKPKSENAKTEQEEQQKMTKYRIKFGKGRVAYFDSEIAVYRIARTFAREAFSKRYNDYMEFEVLDSSSDPFSPRYRYCGRMESWFIDQYDSTSAGFYILDFAPHLFESVEGLVSVGFHEFRERREG